MGRAVYSTFSDAAHWEVYSVLDWGNWPEYDEVMWTEALEDIAERVIDSDGGDYYCTVSAEEFWKVVEEELG